MTPLRLLLALLLLSASAAAQNWPSIGGNNQKNGLSTMHGPASATPLWSVFDTWPTVIGNAVYTWNDLFATARVTFSPYAGMVECRSLVTGQLRWRQQPTDTARMYVVGFTQDAVYAHDYATSRLYALNVGDGTVKWSVPNSRLFPGNSSLVYACNGDPIDFGRRIDRNTGQIRWSNPYIIPVGPDGGFVAHGSTYYHWTGSITTPKTLIAIDMETGQTRFLSASLPGDGDQENDLVAGPDGTIYITRDGGLLYAFKDNGTGFQQLWASTRGDQVRAVGHDGTLYGITAGTNRLARFSPADGSVLDSTSVVMPYGYVTVAADSTVYASDGNGTYYAYSADLHTLRWSLAVGGNVYSAPTLGRDGIMVTIGAGSTITAYRTPRVRGPVADFRTGALSVPAGQPVGFFDQSSYEPTAWSWSFPGGTPSSSTDRNPSGVTYASAGSYEVRLLARNASGADTLLRSCAVTVTPAVAVMEQPAGPAGFSLAQNYPNPFNPATVIQFSVHKENGETAQGGEVLVQLSVYDLLGREVRVLVNGVLPEGPHTVLFDGAGLPSGVYFYRLQAGGTMLQRRMMLVR